MNIIHELIRDPYFIAIMFTIVSGCLIMSGLANAQDKKLVLGYGSVALGLGLILVGYYISTAMMQAILKGG